jgi:hypothetical protein
MALHITDDANAKAAEAEKKEALRVDRGSKPGIEFKAPLTTPSDAIRQGKQSAAQ